MYDLLPIEIAASGMAANRIRMGATASNLANARSTRTPDGEGPYKRRMVVFKADVHPAFANMLKEVKKENQPEGGFIYDSEEETFRLEPTKSKWLVEEHLRGVLVPEIQKDEKVRMEYDPSHPDADEKGYVHYPDISVMSEMTDMISASRNYEANVSVLKNTKDMVTQLMEMLRS